MAKSGIIPILTILFILALIILIAYFAISPSINSPKASNYTNLTISLTYGPTMPVCKKGFSCDSPYSNATILITNINSQFTTYNIQTNSNGLYFGRIPYGNYIIKIENCSFVSCQNNIYNLGNFTFNSPSYTITKLIDTGIR